MSSGGIAGSAVCDAPGKIPPYRAEPLRTRHSPGNRRRRTAGSELSCASENHIAWLARR